MRPFTLLMFVFVVVSCSQNLNVARSVSSELPVSSNPVFARAGLIRVDEVDPTIVVDLQYKGATPLSPMPYYESAFPALVRPQTALRLARANRILKARGYRLKVWDAYRPPITQQKLWDASKQNGTYVVNPKHGASLHSRGTAVDVTLATSTGKPLRMPTGFDSFLPAAASTYEHGDPEVKKNLKVLQSAMLRAGFYPIYDEWWHFLDMSHQDYPDAIPLDTIRGGY